MGSTKVTNETSELMVMKVGNRQGYVTKIATVDVNEGNQTSGTCLKMKVGNHQGYVTKLATVDVNESYDVYIKYDDTIMEYSVGTREDGAGNSVIVKSRKCVQNETIVMKERKGKYNVHMEPRSSASSHDKTASDAPPVKKESKRRFWEYLFRVLQIVDCCMDIL